MKNIEALLAEVRRRASLMQGAANTGYYRDKPVEEFENALRAESAFLGEIATTLGEVAETLAAFQAALGLDQPSATPARPALRVVATDKDPDVA